MQDNHVETGSHLLSEVIASHGGMELWRSISELSFRAKTGGIALPSKLQQSPLKTINARVSTQEIRVVFDNYTGDGRIGILDQAGVRILDRTGQLLASRKEPRSVFRELRRRFFWDRLDALYFGGYAFWNYLNLPFLLSWPDLLVKEGERWHEDGEEWQRLDVSFPQFIPTHCRDQSFYFNQRGLLVRHDYTAEVFGSWARACHYSWDHQETGGILIPRRRRVHPRLSSNKPLRLITLVSIDISEIVLHRNTD